MNYDPTIDYRAVMDDERFDKLPASVRKKVVRIVKMQQQKTATVPAATKDKNRQRNKLAKISRKRNRK